MDNRNILERVMRIHCGILNYIPNYITYKELLINVTNWSIRSGLRDCEAGDSEILPDIYKTGEIKFKYEDKKSSHFSLLNRR